MGQFSKEKLTLVFDTRPLLGPSVGSMTGVRTGVGEYAEQLLRVLVKDGRFRLVLFSNSLRTPSSGLRRFSAEIVHMQYPNRLLDLTARALRRPYLDDVVARKMGRPVHVWFSPHFTSASVRQSKKVVVMHDCSFLHKDFFSVRKRYWHWSMHIARTLKEADAIVAVSAHTRQELLRSFPLSSDTVHTVYPGVDERFFQISSEDARAAVREKYRLPERFILFLGTLEPRKNILTLLQAFSWIAEAHNVDLVLAGKEGWLMRTLNRALARHPFRGRIHRLGFVADEDKNALYRLSACFVYPSLYEGFGFPPLEALACGVPVVVSYATSLPEAVGDRALTIDPYDAEDLTRAIAYCLKDDHYRAECMEKGPAWARQFNWQETAGKISDIIVNSMHLVNHNDSADKRRSRPRLSLYNS